MTKRLEIPVDLAPGELEKLRRFASEHEYCCILDSNSGAHYTYPSPVNYELIIAFGQNATLTSDSGKAFDRLKKFHAKHGDWMFGHLGYDLKNETENLFSENEANEYFPDLAFFVPEYVFTLKKGEELTAHIREGRESKLRSMLAEVEKRGSIDQKTIDIAVEPRISKAQYLRRVLSLKHHIQIGDIYEANFCQDFFGEGEIETPFSLYTALRKVSPAPFSAYYRQGGRHLMCASPERFLMKTGDKLTSQPMKGTAGRGSDRKRDEQIKKALYENVKERAENVMIVDLVRNDLSRTAVMQSVEVEELFGIYEFPAVHQMISTISSRLKPQLHFTDALRFAFPPGSMTGAPKIKAMELIERYEAFKRGLYSGCVGYITPGGDFDFNVVIRSMLYDAELKRLSFAVGGAITAMCDPEREYEECLLKAEGMMRVLNRKQ